MERMGGALVRGEAPRASCLFPTIMPESGDLWPHREANLTPRGWGLGSWGRGGPCGASSLLKAAGETELRL